MKSLSVKLCGTNLTVNFYIADTLVEDPDKRVSAIGIGVCAIFLVIAFAIVICLLDTTNWYRDLKRMRRNLSRTNVNERQVRTSSIFVEVEALEGPRAELNEEGMEEDELSISPLADGEMDFDGSKPDQQD